jgi:ParB family chromosome partitioning protein
MTTVALSAGKKAEMKSKKMPGNQVHGAAGGEVSAEVRQFRLADIVVPRHRARRLRDVTALVESIEQSDLIEPIVVRRLPDGRFVLVAGLHRLEAHRRLHRETILTRIIEVSDLEAELIELDENLARIPLTVLERGEHLLRRKEIYEQLHPEAKHGGAAGKSGGGKKAKDATVASFAEDTAARTIQDDVKIARLGDDTKKAIRGTQLEDQKRVLLQITRIAPEKQAAVAEAVATGRCRTVKQAAIELGEKDKPQPRRAHGDVCARAREVVQPLREARKGWERMVRELDPARASDAHAIGEGFKELDKKIEAFMRSVSAPAEVAGHEQAQAIPREIGLPIVSTRATDLAGPQGATRSDALAPTVTVSELRTRIRHAKQRFSKHHGGLLDGSRSLDDYMAAYRGDPERSRAAMQLLGRDLVAFVREINAFTLPEQMQRPAAFPVRKQGSEVVAGMRPSRESSRSEPQPMQQGVRPAPQMPAVGTHEAAPLKARWQEPAPGEVEQQVFQIIDGYRSGRLRVPFQGQHEIIQKKWPPQVQEAALALFFREFDALQRSQYAHQRSVPSANVQAATPTADLPISHPMQAAPDSSFAETTLAQVAPQRPSISPLTLPLDALTRAAEMTRAVELTLAAPLLTGTG